MDPNANYKEQVELARRLLRDGDNVKIKDVSESWTLREYEDAMRLAELVLAQHEWLSKGGFLPDAWQRKEGK